LDDFGEAGGVKAGAADQDSVDFLLLHQSADVVGLDRAAVENACGFGQSVVATLA